MRPALVVDHWRYLAERRYRRSIHATYRRMARKGAGRMEELLVEHEDDGSCCRREPWPTTIARIIAFLAGDGLAVAVVRPDGLLVGNPDGEREAEALRERVRRAAGGAPLGLGPTARAVRDRMVLRWLEAGGASCEHALRPGTQRFLMAHAAELARCSACCRRYAIAHAGEVEEFTCDFCRTVSGDLVPVQGSFHGLMLTAAACPGCEARIRREASAA